MSKKQTAVEWLENEIRKYLKSNSVMNYDYFAGLFDQAKQMGKEQIIDAYHSRKIINTISAEQYYRETYGGDHD